MAEDKSFKEVTQEIKETNKLIRQQITDENKGSKLGASFKNAAGEIITELAVGRKASKESDQTQAILIKGNEEQTDRDNKNQDENKTIWKGIANTLTGAFLTKKGGAVKTGAEQEEEKDRFSSLKKMFATYLGKDSFVGRNLLKLGSFFSNLGKKLLGKGMGILGLLATASLYGLLLKYLNSEGFKEFMKGDAPKIIGAFFKRIFGKDGLFETLADIFKSDDTLWDKAKDVVQAFRDAIFGKNETDDGTGEKDNSLFGGLSNIQKILLGTAAAMALPALWAMPGLLLKGGLVLGGVWLILEAVKAFNKMLNVNAKMLDEETGELDKKSLRAENIISPVKTYGYNIFEQKKFGLQTVRSMKSNRISYAGVDKKAVVGKVSIQDKSKTFVKKIARRKIS